MPVPNYVRVIVVSTATLLAGCIVGSSDDVTVTQTDAGYRHQVLALDAVRQTDYQIPRRFTGVIRARQKSALGFELAGKLQEIRADEGDRVEQGELLAAQDTTLLLRERDQLSAQVDEVNAASTLNQQNLDRINTLIKKDYASTRERDELVSQQRVYRATLARLDAALAANQARLDKSRLLAPFAGRVSRRLQDTGAVVAAGAPVLELIQSAEPEARIGVPVRFIDALARGDDVTLRRGGRALSGRVLSVGPDLDGATRTVPVRIALLDERAPVEGDLIDLMMPETVTRDGYWLPLTALTDGLRGLWNIYVLRPADGADRFRLEARDVQIEYADGERAFVSGALADGERVVATGLQRLVPGQIVRARAAPESS